MVNVSDGYCLTEIDVTVNVVAVNEAGPVFGTNNITVNVNESVEVATFVALLNASDIDSDELEYSISSGNSDNHFIIDSSGGEIYVNGALDRETVANYSLEITVREKFGTNLASTFLTVVVDDDNDNFPICSKIHHFESLQENSPVNKTFNNVSIQCSDMDEGSNAIITYSITDGNLDEAFELDGSTLLVSNVTAVDTELHPLYQLTVRATDGGGKSTNVRVDVTITNINEHAPQFGNSLYSVSVSEEEGLGYTVTPDIMAVDEDAEGGVMYSITGGNAEGVFRIEPLSGLITLQKSVDREANDEYSLEITATDLAPAPYTLNSTTVLNVTITDVNDNPPFCLDSPYDVSWPEDTSSNSALAVVNFTDADLAPNNNITFAITSGNGEGKFQIDAVDGTITLKASEALDFEGTKDYYLVVSAGDQGNTVELTGTANVAIHVTPVNEHSPVISQPTGGYDTSISENVTTGVTVLTMNGTDQDDSQHPHGMVYWSIPAGNVENTFHMEEMTGVVTLNSPLDRENTPSYFLTVRATDSDPNHYSETNVTLTVDDVNDNSPQFSSGVYGVALLESTFAEVTVLTINATDLDAGMNANHTFSITAGANGGHFFFNDGDLVVNAILDYENKSVYELTVVVTDNGSPSRSASTSVVVTVLSDNDYDPVITSTNTIVTIAEDTPIGTVIYNTTATDQDKGIHGDLYFAIDYTSTYKFLIDPNTGELYVAGVLDFDENPKEYSVIVKVLDSRDDSRVRSSTIAVNITLTDVNDNCPEFDQTYRVDVYEDDSGETSVLTVSASDKDSTTNAELMYSITSGDGQGEFVINSTTGVISTAPSPSFDFESKRFHVLHVQAVDQGSPPLTGSTTVSVNILDSNDNAPVFNYAFLRVSVEEGVEDSREVLSFAANDADGGDNSRLVFGIHHDPKGHFVVHNRGGARGYMVIDKAFDYENTTS